MTAQYAYCQACLNRSSRKEGIGNAVVVANKSMLITVREQHLNWAGGEQAIEHKLIEIEGDIPPELAKLLVLTGLPTSSVALRYSEQK